MAVRQSFAPSPGGGRAVEGRQDPLVHWENQQKLYEAASGPKELHIFDEGNDSCQNIAHEVMHCQYLFLNKHLVEGAS